MLKDYVNKDGFAPDQVYRNLNVSICMIIKDEKEIIFEDYYTPVAGTVNYPNSIVLKHYQTLSDQFSFMSRWIFKKYNEEYISKKRTFNPWGVPVKDGNGNITSYVELPTCFSESNL